MNEKAPLLRPLVRRESGRLRYEVFLSILVVVCLVVLGITIHQSTNPDQEIWSINIPSDKIPPQPFTWDNITPSRTLKWQPCFDGQYDCARLDIPVDWLDPTDDDRVILAIARLRATDTEDYRGPVIFNPGGPGGSGIWSLKDHGRQLQTIVGRNYDIISFDPRGIGASVPRIECWDSTQRRHDWALQETPVMDSYPGALYDAWAYAAAYSHTCERSHNSTGFLQHVGTTSHARDMLEILNQLGEEKLQYWGFSYGTLLGGTFAAMYPDKVGRLVSDGNVDYEEWYNGVHINAVRDADAIMDAFYDLCHEAGPQKCAFYGPTPSDIEARHLAILERLRARPMIHIPSDDDSPSLSPEIITYSKIRKFTATALYRPNYYFPYLAEILAGLEKEDGGAYYDLVARYALATPDVCSVEQIPPTLPLTTEDEGSADGFPNIMCADNKPPVQEPGDYEEYFEEIQKISKTTGAIVSKDHLSCAGRTIRPKWRFAGPFTSKTSFPILYIANMADNITPLVSARNNSAGFEGSVVLIQNSYGVSVFIY